MASQVVTGLLALGGALVGSAASYMFGARAAARQTQVEDARRWLTDRRALYANYLALCESMLREIRELHGTGPHVRASTVAGREYEMVVTPRLSALADREDDELAPALGEVRLMGGFQVGDLAERALEALALGVASLVLDDPASSRNDVLLTSEIIHALRNAMRVELGMAGLELGEPRDVDWPYLRDTIGDEPVERWAT